eukprot:evm.model.scf_259.3 EVM.evm.TU.scf_259.3   scf_259:14241-19239(-)
MVASRVTQGLGLGGRRVLKGIIFDMDGTLTLPVIDFQEMRRRLGVPRGDILEAMAAATTERRLEMNSIVEDLEREALASMEIMPGAVVVCDMLDSAGLPRGLITRNAMTSVDYFYKHCFPLSPFTPSLCREFTPYKPHPAGILHICEQWDIAPEECMMVGDSPANDVACGNKAGSTTVLLDIHDSFKESEWPAGAHPDFKVCVWQPWKGSAKSNWAKRLMLANVVMKDS